MNDYSDALRIVARLGSLDRELTQEEEELYRAALEVVERVEQTLAVSNVHERD